MLDSPESLHNLVEKLKRLQCVLSKSKKSQEVVKEAERESHLDRLPTELLVHILLRLPAQDVARFGRVCKRFGKICTLYRSCLARKQIRMLAVRYGIWHDVLKQRIASTDASTITYRLFSDDFRLQQPIKKRRSGFSRNKTTAPFKGLVRNCSFETALLTVEMMNGDLREKLHLRNLDAGYIYFDLSHHSLQTRALLRYLPGMADDLNANVYVHNVDFIFNTTNETSNCELEQIITNRMADKKVTLIFLKTRCEH